ncbi:GtrA family protein [Roseibium denhamense]|uniref:Flippase GtrA (Transmembrane translocase of bactoprenol-linked glucose) n=1 Tax=Roseibium denhamense TaxID=76305 RepID=A0ABY1P895_9HYPH|nr:GtrA family protein [Roseibium denhamense]MTI04528.1 GtrA family protein [Roseibium denhamense]SMP28303.1 Putative flippase GtrA (transmembrane translocase of bactoprenol-linked glucose) [Roseibium denhamense]
MAPDFRRAGLKTEVTSAGKFAVVGTAATATHAVFATGLYELAEVNVFVANIFGFVIAFCVSFAGHYWWSFSHMRKDGRALASMARFLVIAVVGFALNNVVLTLWLQLTRWPDVAGLLFSIAVVPALSFLGARLWAFSHNTEASG